MLTLDESLSLLAAAREAAQGAVHRLHRRRRGTGGACHAVVLNPVACTAVTQAASSWSPVPPLAPRPPTSTPSR